MKKPLLTLLLALGCCNRLLAVTIDFEAAPSGPLTTFYSGLGVTFSNAWNQFIGYGIPGKSGNHAIYSVAANGGGYGVNAPIVATFSTPQTMVGITGVEVGAAGIRIDAYDAQAGGALVGFQQGFGFG